MREANLYLSCSLVKVSVYISVFQYMKYLFTERRCFEGRRDSTNRYSLACERAHLIDDTRLLVRVKKSGRPHSGYLKCRFSRTLFGLSGCRIDGRDLPLLRQVFRF